MTTAKCEAMSFPQYGNLLSSISGKTPKEEHKDLAVCDLKKKDGIVKEIGRHHDRHTRYIMLMMMVMIMMTLLLMT